MMDLVSRLLPRSAGPRIVGAGPQDAATIAALHAASFQRGWGEDEIDRLLADRSVVTHRMVAGRKTAGFIISRRAGDEAEILSIAVAPARRGRGLARPLLEFHLRTLAGLGIRTVFLEVDEHNKPALHLYNGSGFREVGRRQGYYGSGATALVLRRDLG